MRYWCWDQFFLFEKYGDLTSAIETTRTNIIRYYCFPFFLSLLHSYLGLFDTDTFDMLQVRSMPFQRHWLSLFQLTGILYYCSFLFFVYVFCFSFGRNIFEKGCNNYLKMEMFAPQIHSSYICTRWCKHWIMVYWAWRDAHWWRKVLLLLLVQRSLLFYLLFSTLSLRYTCLQFLYG